MPTVRERLEQKKKAAELAKKAKGGNPRERMEALRAIRAQDPDAEPLTKQQELRADGVKAPEPAKPSEEGVQNFKIRSELSKGDTNEEKIANVEAITGKGTVSIDESGRFVLSEEGRKAAGDDGKGPVFIDGDSTDIQDFTSDFRGDVGAVAAGTAAAIATKGASLVPAIAASGFGSGVGKLVDELAEYLSGDQKQSAGEVAADVAGETALGAGGEIVGRSVNAIGRHALGPNAGKLREGASEIIKDAADIGITVRAPNLVNGALNNIMRKLQGVTDAIFGDTNAFKNSIAINKEIGRLKNRFNAHIDSATDIAEAARDDIIEARGMVREKYNAKFGFVDQIIGNRAIVNTGAIREKAVELFDNLPTKTVKKINKNGTTYEEIAPIIERPELVDALTQLSDLQSVGQLQNLRQILKEEIEFGNLNKTVNEREVSILLESIDTAFEETETFLKNGSSRDATFGKALEQLREAREGYAKDIKIFDNALIQKVAKDPDTVANPYKLVQMMSSPGNEAATRKIMAAVKPETRNRIQQIAMDNILEKVVRLSADSVIDKQGFGGVFDGTALLNEIVRLGGNNADGGVIRALIGDRSVGELRRLGTSIQAATRQKGDKSGALVAASIAVRPFENLGRLAKLAVIGKIFKSDAGIRWLTVGYRDPESEAGKIALEALSQLVTLESQNVVRDDRTEAVEE